MGRAVYAYAAGNPVSGVDPLGLSVLIIGRNYISQAALQNAYNTLAETQLGGSLIKQLEDSPLAYLITDQLSDQYPANYLAGRIISIDPNFHGPTRVVDPCGNQAYENSPTSIILGHEIGHAFIPELTSPYDYDAHNAYEQSVVNAIEQPLRQQLGLLPRGPYAPPPPFIQ